MKKYLSVIPLVLLVCFVVGCQKAAEEPAGEMKAEQEESQEAVDLAQVRLMIEEANKNFGEAVRSGDASALASLYTEDARLLPPNSEMITGKDGIEAFWGGGLQMGIKDAILTTVDLFGMADLVCEIGNYNLTIQLEGQDPMADNGKYIVIWKKADDGTWKLHVDIWNTSLPAQ